MRSPGSFGGDVWHIYYRSLDTLDIGSLNLSNMPGRTSGAAQPGSATCARPRSTTPIPTSSRCTRTASTAAWTQPGGNMALGIHVVHNNLGRTIEDGARW